MPTPSEIAKAQAAMAGRQGGQRNLMGQPMGVPNAIQAASQAVGAYQKLSPEDQAIAGFDQTRTNAVRDIGQQNLVVDQARQAQGLGNQVVGEAGTASAPYNRMMGLAGTDAGAPGLSQAMAAANQLGGTGSFMPGINQTGQQFGRDIGLLRSAAQGTGPSAAQAMMQSSLAANARGARSLAAGARGGNLAGGLRAAIGAGSAANQQAIQQMAALRANEQLTAMGQLQGANAALMAGQTGAQNAETARQNAFANAGQGAAQAAYQGQAVRGNIMGQAGQLEEERRKRALDAYNSMAGNTNIDRQIRAGNLAQRRQIEASQQFTPGQVIGAVGNIAGTALGAGLPLLGSKPAGA